MTDRRQHAVSSVLAPTFCSFGPGSEIEKLEMHPHQLFGNAFGSNDVSILYLADCRDPVAVSKIGLEISGTSQSVAIFHQPSTDVSIPFNTFLCDQYFELLMKKNVIAAISTQAINADATIEVS